MQDRICLNCNTVFKNDYNFCPDCGQKSNAGRLTIKVIITDVIHAFLHADKSIVNLVKELALHPGKVAREYADGRRKKYFNPFTFLVLVVGLSTFAFSAFNVLEINTGQQNPINNYIYKHYNLIVFLNVPVLAFFSWLFFKKTGRNYAENLVLAALLSGERALAFSIFIAPLFYLIRGHSYIILGIYVLLWFIYYTWGSIQFFEKRTTAYILKSFIVPLITQLLTTGIITASIVAYYYKMGR